MVKALFNISAPKKPINLSINSDLLKRARALHINLSATLEARLVELLKQMQRQNLRKDNKAAIEEYNKQVEVHGVFTAATSQ